MSDDDDHGPDMDMAFTPVEVPAGLVSDTARIFAQSVQARAAAAEEAVVAAEVGALTRQDVHGGLSAYGTPNPVDMVTLRARCLEIAAGSGHRDPAMIKRVALEMLTFVLEGK